MVKKVICMKCSYVISEDDTMQGLSVMKGICSRCSMSDESKDYIRGEAAKFRHRKRKEFQEGKVEKWFIDKLNEMYPND